MKKIQRVVQVLAIGIGLLAPSAAFGGLVVNTPIDVIGNLSVAQFTGFGYGTSTYKDWGNEPSVAVNPLDPNQIVISSFSFGTSSTATAANIFFSPTGRATWPS